MKRRRRTEQEKFEIVMEGIRGDAVISEICARHEVHQSQYYQWRDMFLKNGAKIFNGNRESQHERALENRIRKMKEVIGDLTLELKKND